MKLIYLATPYTHSIKAVQEERYQQAIDIVAELTLQGHCVYSPIVHFHPIAEKHSLPGTWEFWKEVLEKQLPKFEEVHVAKMSGWETSTGVKAEMNLANKLNIPISFIDVCS